ncbi:MAG TPA: right-handed parallel beta-helix repeat-containing protein [Streptosporangiaceae bacterium]|nr:right-handed parallel beta-helix repeat-containing protein [Streptosporangiaceae bacterium]
MRRITGAFLSVVLAGSALGALAGAGTANAWPSRVFVSPNGSSRGADVSCRTAGFRSINRAISKVATHGTVIVCPGTYHTQAVVTRPMSLIGRHAVINAKGQKPIVKKLPAGSGFVVYRTRDVQIIGFRVVQAGFDAILVALSRHVLVSHNVLEHNGDVGVDFNGTSFSRAAHNVSKFNKGGGFLVADDIGPTKGNIISWNVGSYNPGGCGVIVAGHSKFGVRDNWIAHNWLVGNGTNPKSAGAGVVIATEVPGETVAGNTVLDNEIFRNGIAGVTIHAHARGQNLSGNRIIGNTIGRNNVVGDPIQLRPPAKNIPDLRTTGILVGASSHVHVWIRRNHIFRNFYGIFLEGLVSAHLHHNHFHNVRVPVRVVP